MKSALEIVTVKERRRRWSDEEKARLVAETLEAGAVISHVARCHGVAESCLYTWRKQLCGTAPHPAAAAPFIPVLLDAPSGCEPAPWSPGAAAPRALVTFSDGTRLEVGADYPAGALQALVGALRGRP